ncbi:hypothetical protein VPH35_106072 [Triticum aestivum]
MAGHYAPCISTTFPSWIRRCSLRPQRLLKQKPARRSRGCRRSRVSRATLPRCRACRPRLRRTATPAVPAHGAPRHSGSQTASRPAPSPSCCTRPRPSTPRPRPRALRPPAPHRGRAALRPASHQ